MIESSSFMRMLEAKVTKYSKKAKTHKEIALRLALWNLKYLFKRTISSQSSFSDNQIHIGVEVLGGLGDLIAAAKYIKALDKYLSPNVIIDVLCEKKGLEYANLLFKNYKCHLYSNAPTYDLHIRLIRFPVILSYVPKRLNKKILDYIAMVNRFHEEHIFIVKDAFTGIALALTEGRKRENQADINNLLNMRETEFCLECQTDIKDILKKFKLSDNYITIQTGAGHCWQDIKNDTRQWPLENYKKLVQLIKKKYPDIKVVQLGSKWQPFVEGVDADLRDKTNTEECISLLKHARLHISQEGGLAHTRHFLHGGKSIVLFGPTDERFYGYDENINLSQRPCPFGCEWLKSDWMKECIKTSNHAECMHNITPEFVMNHVKL